MIILRGGQQQLCRGKKTWALFLLCITVSPPKHKSPPPGRNTVSTPRQHDKINFFRHNTIKLWDVEDKVSKCCHIYTKLTNNFPTFYRITDMKTTISPSLTNLETILLLYFQDNNMLAAFLETINKDNYYNKNKRPAKKIQGGHWNLNFHKTFDMFITRNGQLLRDKELSSSDFLSEIVF